MSEVYRPYSEVINNNINNINNINTINTINYNTGTLTSRVPIATISSGLELPAVFLFDICVGAVNIFPNEYALEGRGYMYTTPRIIPENLARILPEFWIEGKVERLKRIKETDFKDEWLYEYVIIHNPVKNIKILYHARKDSEIKSWYEVIYGDGTVDIFNAEGEIERRISSAGHSLIFTTYAVNKYESLLLKVEDEYGHAKIEIDYGDLNSDIQVVKVVEYLGENREKLTRIQLKRQIDANIKLVLSIDKFRDTTTTEKEDFIYYNYEKFSDNNYYIKLVSYDTGKTIDLDYGTIKYLNNKDIYVITEARNYELGFSGHTTTRYLYTKNTYTGSNGEGWRKNEYYDSCMFMPDDDYVYSVSEIYSVIDNSYPNDNKELFCTKRYFNKYHLLIKEITGFVNEELITWIKKVKTEKYTYGNLLFGKGENITVQPGNYSYWTIKTTNFHKENCEDVIETEYKESLENGLPSKITDKNGIEKTIIYYVDPDLGSATKVVTLPKSIITKSREILDPLDFYNKSVINYVKIGGRGYSDPKRGIAIYQFLYLPSEVLAYKDKNDSGLIIESTKYYAVQPSDPKEYFFFGYKESTTKEGSLILGNCLNENTIYSYLDSAKKLLLVQSYKSNLANKDAPEEKTLIRCFVLNPVTNLCISEWYQLSLEDKTKYNLTNSTYDNFGRLLTKVNSEGTESYHYYKQILRDPYDTTDFHFYRSYEYTDIYGLKQRVFSTIGGQTSKIYGIIQGNLDANILEKNEYMAAKYLKENIVYDYSSSNVKEIAIKTIHDYKEFKLLKTTFPDETFETYENDEFLKRKIIKKNDYLKNAIEFDAFDNIICEKILNETLEEKLTLKIYDEYNRLIKIKKYDNYHEEYSYDNFNRLVTTKITPLGSGEYAYKEKLIYPATALNSDKAITKTCNSDWSYSARYNNYGELIYENDNNYEYDSLREKQLKKISNDVGEVNYTYYLENDLPKTIDYTQKKTEEPFKTIYDSIVYDSKYNLISYTVKNLESNTEKNCAQMNYTYTPLGGKKSFELKIGENINNLQSTGLITKNYTTYENLILSTNYSYVNSVLINTYEKSSSNLKTAQYTFGDSVNSITFELTYNKNNEPNNYTFGQLETITMVAPNFSIDNTLIFTYDSQGRESERTYYNTADKKEIFLNIVMEYTLDSKIISTDVFSPQKSIDSIKRTNYYDSKTGKLKESRTNYNRSDYAKHEIISSESPELISLVQTIKGKNKIDDIYIRTKTDDSLIGFEQRVNNVIVAKENLGQDSCGNYTNDFDNSKIIYNAANKVVNVEKKETSEKYNYYYYMTGELMCVSEMKANPRKIYYLYDNGKNIGELIYEGTTLKIATLYLDVHGIRLGRYIKDYEQNKESIELFFSELGGTVYKVSLYEKAHGVRKTEDFEYSVYGEIETNE